MILKIAAVTDDGERISNHFGRARFFKVFTLADGQIVSVEMVAKPHHASHSHEHDHRDHGHGHEQDHASQPIELHEDPESHGHHFGMHNDMLAPIFGAQVLLCGGMGTPAYQKAQAAGLEVILTGGEIEKNVQAYIKGELQSDLRRVHNH